MINSVATTASMASEQHSLRQRWADLKQQQPKLRTRDAAYRLGVSEAELIASCCSAKDTCTSIRLHNDWNALLSALAEIGTIMALTRNQHVVIEKTGPVEQVEIYQQHGMGSIVGEFIDLRLFLNRWVYAFAVTEETKNGVRHSLQFFDAQGTAIHKIYLVEKSDLSAYQQLLDAHAATDQTSHLSVQAAPLSDPVIPDNEIDSAGLQTSWAEMQDTHEFYGLLRRFKVRRLQALKLVGKEWAYPVRIDAHRLVLETARDIELPIMVFVSSPGTIQIHTGSVHKLATVGEWYNVLDPTFNLHLRETAIANAWVVRKPTVDGYVTGLELFDHKNELITMFFGRRKDGQKESDAWRHILYELPKHRPED